MWFYSIWETGTMFPIVSFPVWLQVTTEHKINLNKIWKVKVKVKQQPLFTHGRWVQNSGHNGGLCLLMLTC